MLGRTVTGGLDAAARTRYSRHLLLPEIAEEGQRRLGAARVLVVGAGGLGSAALLYLAAAGVGTLGVVDDDVVELGNLHRQVLHGTADIGRAKVDSAAEAITRLDPAVRVECHHARIGPHTPDFTAATVAAYDVVVDGSDNFPTRYAVNDACVRAGVPLVWASVLRFDAQVAVWWAGRGPCLRCVFPRPPAQGDVPSCAEAGVLGALCGTVGSLQAVEAVKLLLGVGDPLVGRLLVHDALRQTWDTLVVRADPACPTCHPRPGVEDDSGTDSAAPIPDVSGAEPVPQVSPRALAAQLRGPVPPRLVDVRPAPEREIVAIPGAVAIELSDFRSGVAFERPELGAPDEPLVCYCRSGARSAEATRLARAAGWRYAANLDGGVLAWVREVDSTHATY